ncbi:MAG: histidine--tRNA ligase [Planctomycetota bacterium]
MALITPRSVPGTLELLPREQVVFQKMMDRIRCGFERFGYLPVETPVMELSEILLTKTGGETEKQVYFAISSGALKQGRDPELALRFDLTVPLARYVAEHEHKLQFPFRRYQMQRVYRGERMQRGRYREFYQCDIDVIGKDALSIHFDAEVPAAIYGVLRDLELSKFTIHINNRKLLLGFFSELAVAPDRQALVLREIDKLDKRGREQVATALSGAEIGLSPTQIARVLELTALGGVSTKVLAQLRALGITEPQFVVGLTELTQVTQSLVAFGVPEQFFRINLAIARGLDYYTGTVYETLIDAQPDLGSICSGGRYDNLAGYYTRSRLPGVGMSIGATRLFYQLLESGRAGAGGSTAQVLVTQQDVRLFSDYVRIAAELRAAGIATELILEDWKFARQMKYANAIGVPLVVIFGASERDANCVTLKNMINGEQVRVPCAELARHILALPPATFVAPAPSQTPTGESEQHGV